MNDPRQWVYKGVCLPGAILHLNFSATLRKCTLHSVFIEECGVIVTIYLRLLLAQDYIHHSKTWLISEFYLTDVVEKIALTSYV